MTGGEKSVNPLRDEASLKRRGNQKKKTCFAGLFFLTGLRPVLPSISAHPANSIRCSSNIAIADHFPSNTFAFKHHLTGEAWPACKSNSTFSFKQHLTGEACLSYVRPL